LDIFLKFPKLTLGEKMEQEKNNFGLLEQMQFDIKKLQCRVDLLENTQQKDDFTVKHYKGAVKIVGCCRQTLKKAIDDGKLILGNDYRYNGKRYLFSISSLQKIKGTI
jgi:hypothetical protein